MKKIILGMLMASLLVAAGTSFKAAHAETLAERVIFSGKVLLNGTPQPNASVLVECWGKGNWWYITTDSHGAYYLVTDTDMCPLGTELKVRSETSTFMGHKYGIVQKLNAIDIDVIAKIPVPEYGWAGGILAAGAGLGALTFVRRRHARESSL